MRIPRLFATAKDEPRSRRAGDAITLVAATIALLAISPAARPQPGFGRALERFVRSLPTFLLGGWQILVDSLVLLTVVIIVAAAIRRRWPVVRDLALAAIIAAVVSVAIVRYVHGEWPSFENGWRSVRPPAWYPSIRLSITAAVVMTASPHLALPMRRLGRWLIGLSAIAVAALGATSPLGAVAALLVAVGAAALVHLVFGSSAGRPSLELVRDTLAELGVITAGLEVADRQTAGLFEVHGFDADGAPLVVRVYGRDAHDSAVVSTLWRKVWYRSAGEPLRIGRLQQVEHEAFLTLLAGQAGVHTDRVVVAGSTTEDDALLVLRRPGRAVDADALDTAARRRCVTGIWQALDELHGAAIAHGQVDDRHLLVEDDDSSGQVGLIDFRGAVVAPTTEQRHLDLAQAYLTTVGLVGEDVAGTATLAHLGAERLADMLPMLQPTAMTPHQQRWLRDRSIDLDDLRAGAARLAGTEPPALQRLRRFTIGSVLRVLLPGIALVTIVFALSGVDFSAMWEQVREASWWLLLIGLVVTQLPRFTQALSTLGASPVPLPLGPVYALQLAVSYINVAIPASAARIAVNVRFFQRHGVSPGVALAAGGLDGIGGLVAQVLLLVSLLSFTSASLDLDLGAAAGSAASLLPIVLVVVVLAVAPILLVARLRRFVSGWVHRLGLEAFEAMRGLRSPRRLGLLLGGNIASEVLFAAALGVFTLALGTPVGIGELLLINIGVGLLSGLIPVPGGVGVAEGGLTYGLVLAGMPEENALAAVLLYRMSSFYLPPIWGYFAMKWLERHKHL